jgi:phenylacetate-CoA ligase
MGINLINYFRYRNTLNSLQKNTKLSIQQLRLLQEKKLRKILYHAYHHVPYYNSLFRSTEILPNNIKCIDDLRKLPITTKATLKTLGTSAHAKNCDLNKCSRHKTSGSTGMPLEIIYDSTAAAYASASYERARRENGYNPHKDIFLNISGQSYRPSWLQKFGLNNRYTLNVLHPLVEQMNVMRAVNPTVLWGYPSAIQIIAQQIEQNEIESAVRLVFTASEINPSDIKDYISSVFNADVIDVYGSWETGCIAWECEKHEGYHVSMDNVVIEIVDHNGDPVAPGERGKVVVTNLNSYAMPFIRYELGDIAVSTDEECSCGRAGFLMKQIEGRYDDFIKTSSGNIVSPRIFTLTFRSIPNISGFQIIQEKLDLIHVFVEPSPTADRSQIQSTVISELHQILGRSMDIEVTFVDAINRTSSGKLRSVISNV